MLAPQGHSAAAASAGGSSQSAIDQQEAAPGGSHVKVRPSTSLKKPVRRQCSASAAKEVDAGEQKSESTTARKGGGATSGSKKKKANVATSNSNMKQPNDSSSAVISSSNMKIPLLTLISPSATKTKSFKFGTGSGLESLTTKNNQKAPTVGNKAATLQRGSDRTKNLKEKLRTLNKNHHHQHQTTNLAANAAGAGTIHQNQILSKH